jgi:Thioredoxin
MKGELAAAKRLLGKEQNLKIFSLDAEKWPHLGTRYGIQKLPCILLVHDGVIKKRIEGVTKADLIVKELRGLT